METFPKFDLFPRITKVAEGIKRVALAGSRTELCLTEHKRGAAEMLDRAMDNQPELPFQITYQADAQLAEAYRSRVSYDDIGNWVGLED